MKMARRRKREYSPNAPIAPEKLVRYLLVAKPKNDKSRFLAQAGFTLANPEALEAAIRQLISNNEAVFERENEYGAFYRVKGELQGPDGILTVVTIWLLQDANGEFRFVTLKPAR
jgi:hypothetical protein